jgi:hypothetical protein
MSHNDCRLPFPLFEDAEDRSLSTACHGSRSPVGSYGHALLLLLTDCVVLFVVLAY